ncbi:MAG: enoyl-CoA hydratase/isomerase family protein [Rhodospirillaceae bacterium]
MSLIDIRLDGAVRTVTLNRPEKRNALNADMMTALTEAFTAAPADGERVTVIRAEGKVFCAGLELSSDGLKPGAEGTIVGMFDAVQRYPLPVVARVHGAAIAGGCELALHCDFVVAAEDAPFGMPLAQLGVTTDWFLTKKIMETAGLVVARELLLLGDPLPAKRLHDWGFMARCVPAALVDGDHQAAPAQAGLLFRRHRPRRRGRRGRPRVRQRRRQGRRRGAHRKTPSRLQGPLSPPPPCRRRTAGVGFAVLVVPVMRDPR